MIILFENFNPWSSCNSAENATTNGCPATRYDDWRIWDAGWNEANGPRNGNVSSSQIYLKRIIC